MGANFSQAMRNYFGCEEGAYSVVTPDEYKKSQITFVGPEQSLAEKFFGNRISNNHGSIESIKDAGFDPNVEFYKFPTGEVIILTVSYKTNKPNELRMYLRTNSFKPNAGENWGIFIKDSKIWICHFSEWLREQIENQSVKFISREKFLDQENDNFQDQINSRLPTQTSSLVSRWSRDRNVALQAMVQKNHKCELYPGFPTFNSKSSGLPFLEAHHLVPMNVQSEFTDINLDTLDNVCILNPLVHRKLHHAKFEDIAEDLKRLISNRLDFLKRINIIEEDVLGLYR
jgi:5-methylcytosine-specific restriction enzyme A